MNDDWTRYGASRLPPVEDEPSPATKDAVRPVALPDRDVNLDEDLFREYRGENGIHSGKARGTARGGRFARNIATLAIVVAVGGMVALVGLATSGPIPAASPSTRVPGFGAAGVAASSGGIPVATTKLAHVGLLIDLPLKITSLDHGQSFSDGKLVYLTDANAGIAIDPATGAFGTVFGGPAFAKGARRVIVQNGLWVSSWPTTNSGCGPECWASSTTYRLDAATGNITKTLAGAYLLGSTGDAVWVAVDRKIQRLDPSSGAVKSSIPWSGSGEARLGCGALWSYTPAGNAAVLAQVDPSTGNIGRGSTLDPSLTYGPITVQGQCWVMNGVDGAAPGTLSIAQLNLDGSTQAAFSYPFAKVVVLDGEFWKYAANGLIQRFDVASGTTYGTPYLLPTRPSDDDPKWFFAAAGVLWLVDGGKLTLFDVQTGSLKKNG